MCEDVVSFHIARYELVPATLARIAGDLEDAARSLRREDHPAAGRAARALDGAAVWVRAEQAAAAARWERIMAIPGIHLFNQWRSRREGRTWDFEWLTGDDGLTFSFGQLEAITSYRAVIEPLLSQIEREEPLDPDDVDAAIALLAAADQPEVAATLLNLLGADGFFLLHRAAAATAGDLDDPDAVERLEDELGVLTATFATATNARGRVRLDPAFVDGFVGAAEALDVEAEPTPEQIDAAMAAFAQLDFSREVAARLAAVTGPSGGVAVLERLGRPFIVITVALPLVELLRHGPLSEEFVTTSITTALSIASFLAEGALASFGFFVLGAVIALIAASGEGGAPRRPSRGGAGPTQGTSVVDYYLNDHGVPVTANGV